MRRSFWVAVAGATVAVTVLGVLAGVLLAEVAACQMAIFGPPSLGVCAGGVWPVPWLPWPLLGASLTVAMSVVVVGVVTAWRQVAGARRHVRGLAATSVPVPNDVREMAEEAGIPRLLLVDAPSCVAVTHGLLRPIVVISTGLVDALDRQELGAVLAHEAEHVDRRDPLRILVARIVAAALWPFPLLKDLVEHGALGSEISADRAAAADVGLRPLASALNRVMSGPPVAESFAASSIDGLRYRIRGLGSPDDPPLELCSRRLAWSGVSASVIVAGVAMLTLAALPSTASATPDPTSEAVEPSDGKIPVGGDNGERVGWTYERDLDELAEHGGVGRVPVYDGAGVQVGWFETGQDGGFRPLDD